MLCESEVSILEKRDPNQYPDEQTNEQQQGFFASLESLSNNLLDLVTNEEPNSEQEDQLQ